MAWSRLLASRQWEDPNLSSRHAEKNALILADAIIHYQENPLYQEEANGQDTLF